MKALTKIGAGAEPLELRVDALAGPPPRDHVTLRVVAAGICGTDLHIRDDEYPSQPPVILGHEVGGIVEFVGEGVPEHWLGRRVAIETFFSTCGTCLACRTGRTNLCPQRRSIGSHVNGGMAEYVISPVRNLHPVPEWLPDAALALIEPLACVCNALCRKPLIRPGDTVLVLGPGAIGNLAAQVAKISGGRPLLSGLVSDEARLGIARELGIDTANVSDVADHALARNGFDVVIECSGAQAAIVQGLQTIRKGGSYVQMGLSGRPVSVPFDELCYREIDLTSGFASTPASWERAMTLVTNRAVALAPLVTEVAALADWRRIFARTGASDGVKFVFDPRL